MPFVQMNLSEAKERLHATTADKTPVAIGYVPNIDRAKRILGILSKKGDKKIDPYDVDSSVSDLLADIMHFSRMTGLDFEDMLRRAESNFVEETAESC